jgi:hypothetical protein
VLLDEHLVLHKIPTDEMQAAETTPIIQEVLDKVVLQPVADHPERLC